MLRPLTVLAALAAAGCAPSLISSAPGYRALAWSDAPQADEEPGWRRFVTNDFEFFTDFDLKTGRWATEEFQRAYVAMSAAMGDLPRRPDRTLTIVAMRDERQFALYFGPTRAGVTIGAKDRILVALRGQPKFWFYRSSQDTTRAFSVVAHELAHAVAEQRLARQPRWFAEGLAIYASTYQWSHDNQTVAFGSGPLLSDPSFLPGRDSGLRDVAGWSGGHLDDLSREKLPARYAYAWGLVHFLINREPERFGKIVATLASAEKPTDTLIDLFDGVDPEALDRKVFAWLARDEFPIFRQRVPQTPSPAHLERLSEAGVTALFRTLETSGQDLRRRARPPAPVSSP